MVTDTWHNLSHECNENLIDSDSTKDYHCKPVTIVWFKTNNLAPVYCGTQTKEKIKIK